MSAETAVGVEGERSAVEDELVLAANHVEVDERQRALHHPRNGDVLAGQELAALVRRGVGDEQDFAAGFKDAFDRVGAPDVLADRHADPHAAKHDRSRRWSGREHPLLVEDAVIGQIDLEPDRFDPPAVEERHRVVELAVLDPGQADQRRRAAVGGVARQLIARRAAGLLKRGFEHQILGRIAREVEFRRHHDIGPEGRRLLARFAQPVAVSRDVADDRGYLRQRDDEAVRRRGHGRMLSAGRGRVANERRPICCLAVERRSKTQGAGVTVFGAAAGLAAVHYDPQLPRVLIAREATMASVASEMQLSSIISNLARAVSGATSVVLNAVAVEKARNK